ncbi:hypothetical protein LOTGIDRAFT_228935 [Lottia gigantea]|uniref:Glutathione peroxidase n=1 Tax=Lottia gigantea TaxID=225164 RepID=V4A6V1_LOTGI|nr:hypothetical protein LOTGIDRAFT_228935 [Lottia gigantea]ESO88991.1 hypothetical protein LOTGIDRAFT_228935 [Lottia gigantea]
MTPHYYGLNALQTMYGARGFKVLGFPCNQFNLQEPGGNGTEILNGVKYVRPGGGFVPNFQMFHKIQVNGQTEEPLYTYLKKYCKQTSNVFESDLFYSPLKVGDISWNFETFLIDKQGKVRHRFSPDVDPMSLGPHIQQLLNRNSLFNVIRHQ